MSIASEIERIDGLKDRLGTKLQGMGLVSPATNLEASVEAVEGIADNGAANGSGLQRRQTQVRCSRRGLYQHFFAVEVEKFRRVGEEKVVADRKSVV